MSKSENNHDNSDFQMLKEEISESEYQNAQYEAEKKNLYFIIAFSGRIYFSHYEGG